MTDTESALGKQAAFVFTFKLPEQHIVRRKHTAHKPPTLPPCERPEEILPKL